MAATKRLAISMLLVSRDIKPNVIKVGLGARSYAMRHL
jgi:hypothetical protein